MPRLDCIWKKMSAKLMSEKSNLGARKATIDLSDDVMIEILSRLPMESMLRFMYACKLWKSLVCDYYFMTLQLKNRPDDNHPSVVLLERQTSKGGLSLHLYNERRHLSKKFCMEDSRNIDRSYSFSNSCNGLISVFGWTSAFLVNPVTHEFVMLPKVSPLHGQSKTGRPFGGLAFDTSTGEYKIVRFFVEQEIGVCFLCCEILTLGSNSWKRIDSIKMVGYECSAYGGAPVIVNGDWHWPANNIRKYGHRVVALVLCIRNEALDEIQHPDSSSAGVSGMGELGGCLSVVYIHWSQIHIWLLKDYDKRLWVKQYNFRPQLKGVIDLSTIFIWKPLVVYNGEILMHELAFQNWYCALPDYHPENEKETDPEPGNFYCSLSCYDPENGEETTLDAGVWADATLHIESLVSPRLQQQCRVEDRHCASLCEKTNSSNHTSEDKGWKLSD